MEQYLVNTIEDELLQVVVKHQLYLASMGKHSNLQTASNILWQYEVCPNLEKVIWAGDTIPEAREGILQLKAAQVVKLVITLTVKPIHKVYYQQACSVDNVDTEGTFSWLSDGRFSINSF